MDAQKEKAPVIKRETKNKIRVDFDRTPLKDRLKAKFLSTYFLGNIIWWIFRLVLLIGISYIVLYPYLSQIPESFMAPEDFVDVTVILIPKHFNLDIYRAILTDAKVGFFNAFGNTFILSISTALIQTFVCALIGYGFAKFKFRGRNLLFMMVVLTMIIPHQSLQLAMSLRFSNFDVFGLLRLLNGGGIQILGFNLTDLNEGVAEFFEKIDIISVDRIRWGKEVLENRINYKINMEITKNGINLMNTNFPLIILSLGGLAFKNGLYIFLLRQFYRGIPDELEESAYMDGSGTFRTFLQIILPLSIPMLITVFLFSFSWQWTDTFYVGVFFRSSTAPDVLSQILAVPSSLSAAGAAAGPYHTAAFNTFRLLIIAPLVVLYAFLQKFLVQGLEHSGIAN